MVTEINIYLQKQIMGLSTVWMWINSIELSSSDVIPVDGAVCRVQADSSCIEREILDRLI